jgi:hypothetical protein
LRDLGLGLSDVLRVLDGKTTVAEVAAAHLEALDAQAHVLRLRRAVLSAVVAPPRRHPSMIVTWQPSRRGPCIRTDMPEATQVRIIGDVLGRRIKFEELSPDEFRSETKESWPRPVVNMLLTAWGATTGSPAFVTSTVSDILGSAPRSFRQWVADNATAFTDSPE